MKALGPTWTQHDLTWRQVASVPMMPGRDPCCASGRALGRQKPFSWPWHPLGRWSYSRGMASCWSMPKEGRRAPVLAVGNVEIWNVLWQCCVHLKVGPASHSASGQELVVADMEGAAARLEVHLQLGLESREILVATCSCYTLLRDCLDYKLNSNTSTLGCWCRPNRPLSLRWGLVACGAWTSWATAGWCWALRLSAWSSLGQADRGRGARGLGVLTSSDRRISCQATRLDAWMSRRRSALVLIQRCLSTLPVSGQLWNIVHESYILDLRSMDPSLDPYLSLSYAIIIMYHIWGVRISHLTCLRQCWCRRFFSHDLAGRLGDLGRWSTFCFTSTSRKSAAAARSFAVSSHVRKSSSCFLCFWYLLIILQKLP